MLKFRPHHFLCAVGYQGKGYSKEFVEGFDQIKSRLDSHPDEPIQVVDSTDSICAPCPERRGELCSQQAKISELDQKHSEALGWVHGDVLTWSEARKKIGDQLSLEEFHQICQDCEWKEQGICEKALKSLKSQPLNS